MILVGSGQRWGCPGPSGLLEFQEGLVWMGKYRKGVVAAFGAMIVTAIAVATAFEDGSFSATDWAAVLTTFGVAVGVVGVPNDG